MEMAGDFDPDGEAEIDRLLAALDLELPDVEPDGDDDGGEDQEWMGWSAYDKPAGVDEEGNW